jgi:hypothetical protein
MRDIISLQRLQLLHPAVKVEFQKFITTCEDALNITIRIVQGLRTFPEQQAIYNQGRTTPGKVATNSKPGQSYHNFGMAVDLGILSNGKIDWDFDYNRLQLFMPASMTWGADWDHDGVTKAHGDTDEHFVDGDHYEITLGHNWRDLLAKYNRGEFIPGTKYVNLT